MIKYVSCSILLFLLSSCLGERLCTDKTRFLEGYASFTKDVGQNYLRFDADDWKHIDREFQSYIDRCYPKYKSELQLREKLEFWKSTLTYGYFRDKATEDEIAVFDHIELDLSKEFEELSIESKEELERFIKDELGDELEQAIDEVVKGIQSISEELKNWLNNQ